jgi:hypothetical protein
LDGTRWKRFNKEFQIPTYCNEDAIHGNFMQGILSVVMPKKNPLILQQEEEEEREIPELEHDKEKEDQNTYQKMEFGSRGIAEKNEITSEEEEDTHKTEYAENEMRLPPETTREVALKFMVVIIMILVLLNFLADISKSLVAEAQSYFYN